MPVSNWAHSQQVVATFCRGTTTGRLTSLWPTSAVSRVANIVCAKAAYKSSESSLAGSQTLQGGSPAIEEYCTEIHEALTWAKSVPQGPTAENL